MAQIQLPLGLSGKRKLPKTINQLRGCFNTGDGDVVPMPGITALQVFVGAARGAFRKGDFVYGVWGTELRKIINTATGATILIGTILGSNRIETAGGFNETVILSKGENIYTLDNADTIVEITNNANFVASVDVAQINGIFVYIPSDGSPAFFSDPGDAGSVQPLSFFTAEELPDRNNGVFNLSNTLFITGTDSIQKFDLTGGTPNPFTVIQKSRQNFGFIGALQEFGDTFLFIGREKDQDFGMYQIGTGRTIKISNDFIDELLATYTLAELQAAVPNRIKWLGYDLAIFTLARDSFGFHRGQFFGLDTLDNGVSRPTRAGFIAQVDGFYFSASENELGKISDTSMAFGLPIPRIIQFGFDHPNNKKFSCQSIGVGISQGFNVKEGTVALLVSRDGILFGPALYRDLGKLGQYNQKLGWNYSGGLGSYDGFMAAQFYTTQAVHFAADSLFVNAR